MHLPEDLSRWIHDHQFGADTGAAERGTWVVVGITAVMMVLEIAGGRSEELGIMEGDMARQRIFTSQ